MERMDMIVQDAGHARLAKFLKHRPAELAPLRAERSPRAHIYLVEQAEEAARSERPAKREAVAPAPPPKPDVPAVNAQKTLQQFTLLAEYEDLRGQMTALDAEWAEVKSAHIAWKEIRTEIETTRKAALEASRKYASRTNPEGALNRIMGLVEDKKTAQQAFSDLKLNPNAIGIPPNRGPAFYSAFYPHYEARKKVRQAAAEFRKVYPGVREPDNRKMVALGEKEGIDLVKDRKKLRARMKEIEQAVDIPQLRQAAKRLPPAERQKLIGTVGANPERLMNQKLRAAAKVITKPGLER
jgi:hypothetical protein